MSNHHTTEFNDILLQKITNEQDRIQLENLCRIIMIIGIPHYECKFYNVTVDSKEKEYVITCDFQENTVFDFDEIIRVYRMSSNIIKKFLIYKYNNYMRLEIKISPTTQPYISKEITTQIIINRRKYLKNRAIQITYEYDTIHTDPKSETNGSQVKKVKFEKNQ